MMQKKIHIRSLDRTQLVEYLHSIGEKKFRADQILQWLWQKGVSSFDEMQNLSKALREQLAGSFEIGKVEISSMQKSQDGTRKYAFELSTGQQVEGVLIPTPKRLTACISSQSGCSLDCKFCATGYLPYKYNLSAFEIYDQVFALNQEALKNYGRPLTNIVYMGMGEPLLNYRNVMESIRWISAEGGLGMSPQRITVSTSGIAKMIRKLGDDEVKFEFALSLHTANNEKRNQIMSINHSNPLEDLAEALKYFYEKTRTRVTYEYCIFKDFNDGIEDARELAAFSRIIPSKVNIIEYNPVAESGFENTSSKRMDAFIRYLEKQKVIVNVRRSRGKDIDGACGQLALRNTQKV
ncbi:MAG: 23S rRNA (adenine(2503)-C(2))-methyltransferase RlmN [Bacteroidota bacterium]